MRKYKGKFFEEIKITLSGKRLNPSNSVTYLFVRIDDFLRWHDQVTNITVKLNRASALLLKIRNFVKMKKKKKKKHLLCNIRLPSSIFFLVCAKNSNTVNRLIIH